MPFLSGNDQSIGIKISSTANTKGIDETSRSVSHLSDTTSTGRGSFLKLSAAVAAGQAIFAAASAAFRQFGDMAIKSTAEYEQSRVAFDTMLGSADKAKLLMADIAEFAKSTPFELPDVVAGTKQLLAFGFAQEELLPTMKRLGDIASGVGVPVGQLTNVFGQVRVAGRLMGQDLLQFTNAGVPMIEYLSKTMGVAQEDIKDLISKGGVGFEDVKKALEAMTNEGSKFGGMMDKQSKTFDGVVSNIKDGFGQMARSAMGMSATGEIMENSLFDRLKKLSEKIMPGVQRASEAAGPSVAIFMEKLDGIARSAWDVANRVGDYLGPKFEALYNTINERLIPILEDLWKNVIEPLAPVIGTVLVGAIGLAVDILNGLLQALGWVWQAMQDGNPFILGLIGLFGTLGAAMALQKGIAAFQAASTLINTSIIPSITAKVTAMRALIASPITMGAIGIGAAIAAIVLVQQKLREVRDEFDNTMQNISKANKSSSDAIAKLKAMTKAPYSTEIQDRARKTLAAMAESGFASGGYTGPGGKDEVAGVVHKGEYVLRKDQVDQTTGRPKQDATPGRSVVMNNTYNVYNQVDLDVAVREQGWRLATA